MSGSTVTMPDLELGRASVVFETPGGEIESFEVHNEYLVGSGRTR